MTEYFVESWNDSNPDDRNRTDCRDWKDADELAMALARDGENAVVLHVEASYMAEPVDLCELNGVRPGIDFPATL